MAKIGRNDPCRCGSGKKYKKCCEPKDNAPRKLIGIQIPTHLDSGQKMSSLFSRNVVPMNPKKAPEVERPDDSPESN